MNSIVYRNLMPNECERINEIDASQFIGRAWREVNGVRQLIDINYQDPGFPNGYENHLAALKETIKNGGSALGAFDILTTENICQNSFKVFGREQPSVGTKSEFLFVPRYNNRLVGFCSIDSKIFGIKSNYALLDQIFISLEYRSKGIGRQLFLRSVAEAKKIGADKLYICAGSSEETIAFYRALGCIDAIEINTELYEGDTRDMQLEYSFQ